MELLKLRGFSHSPVFRANHLVSYLQRPLYQHTASSPQLRKNPIGLHKPIAMTNKEAEKI